MQTYSIATLPEYQNRAAAITEALIEGHTSEDCHKYRKPYKVWMNSFCGYPGQSWQSRHYMALVVPRNTGEQRIVSLLEAIANCPVEPYSLEQEIPQPLIRACHALLDYDCGRLDCGAISTFLHSIMPGEL